MKNVLVQSLSASVVVSEDFSNTYPVSNFSTLNTLKIDNINYHLKVGKVRDLTLPLAFYSLEDVLAIVGEIPTNYVNGGSKVRGSNLKTVLKGLLLANNKSIWDYGDRLEFKDASLFDISTLDVGSSYFFKDYEQLIGINEIEVEPDVDIRPLDSLLIDGKTRLVLAVRVPLVNETQVVNPYREEKKGPRKTIVF